MIQRVVDVVKREGKYLGIVFAVLLVIFQAAFYKQNFGTVFFTVVSLLWVFILPGYCIMLYWQKLEFLERLVIGTVISAAATGVISYYFGLVGVNIASHGLIVPPLLIILGIVNFLRS